MKLNQAHPLTETPQNSDDVANIILEAEQGMFEEVDVDEFLNRLDLMIEEAKVHEAAQQAK